MEDNLDSITAIESRHRKEKKELQAKIQALKKAAKNDKTKKKEATLEIARLEMELDMKHKDEIDGHKGGVHDIENDNNDDIEDDSENKVKISKAQRRRDKKSQQEKEREEQIKQQAKENIHGPRNVETVAIKSKLKDKKLKMHPIPSDGDCLYKAVSHQLSTIKQQERTVLDLRCQVSEYIFQNKDDFYPFMSNPKTRDMLTDAEFQEYCDKIKNTKTWGGQLEIRALSHILKCPINVIQSTGPACIEQGVEFEGPPLTITYHRHLYQLGEHYNSTVICEEDEEQE